MHKRSVSEAVFTFVPVSAVTGRVATGKAGTVAIHIVQ